MQVRHRLRSLVAAFALLAGGVTTSLAMDAHGKSLSYALLEMEIDT